MAFLVVLESLTPAERVALILHDVFPLPPRRNRPDHRPHPAACRQLVSSARYLIDLATRVPATVTFLERTVNG